MLATAFVNEHGIHFVNVAKRSITGSIDWDGLRADLTALGLNVAKYGPPTENEVTWSFGGVFKKEEIKTVLERYGFAVQFAN